MENGHEDGLKDPIYTGGQRRPREHTAEGASGQEQAARRTRESGTEGAAGQEQAVQRARESGAEGTSGQEQAARRTRENGAEGTAVQEQAVRRARGSRPEGTRAQEQTAGGTGRARQRGSQPEQASEPESFSSKVAQIRLDLDRKKKRRRRIIIMAVAECIVLACIFSYAYVSRLWNLMPRPNVDEQNVENANISVETIKKMQGYWMIAIFGVDSGTGTSSARGNNSDVNMIACINRDTGEIKLVSVYRDTYLKVNDKGDLRKFNYSYASGGPEQALKMLNENLDLNITEYIVFNWKAVADGINFLGGVDLEITNAEFKYINSFITETVQETGVPSVHLQSAGMNHLDGVQAVAYARLRLMDSDYQRVERQKKVIAQAFEKAKHSDYAVLNQVLVVCLQEVMTNLDFADLTSVALSITKYHIGETGGFPFNREGKVMGKIGDCIIPKTLESNVSQLHQFLFGDEAYEPTDAVKKISQKISENTGFYEAGTAPAVNPGSGSGSGGGSSSGSGSGSNSGSGSGNGNGSGSGGSSSGESGSGGGNNSGGGSSNSGSSETQAPTTEAAAETEQTTAAEETTAAPEESSPFETGIIIEPSDIMETDAQGQLVGDNTVPPPEGGVPGESTPAGQSGDGSGQSQPQGSEETAPGQQPEGPGETTPGQQPEGPGDTTPGQQPEGPGETTPGQQPEGPGETTPGQQPEGPGETGPGEQPAQESSSAAAGDNPGGDITIPAGPGETETNGSSGGEAAPGPDQSAPAVPDSQAAPAPSDMPVSSDGQGSVQDDTSIVIPPSLEIGN